MRDEEFDGNLSPEDIVLQKLEWYRKTAETSDRQWRDVLGVLKVQGSDLDLAYLRHWTPLLGVEDLLERAHREAGLRQIGRHRPLTRICHQIHQFATSRGGSGDQCGAEFKLPPAKPHV